jgi:hypothetical protein
MKHLTRLMAIGSLALLLALVSTPSLSFAHERRTIAGGKYDVVVGWAAEPAYVNQKNAASIRISKSGTNPAEPIVGADKTLKVDIRQGAQTKTFALRAEFGQPGYYVADVVPTREGDYQWTFNGSIGADPVTNEKFDTADGKFDKVDAISGLQFPLAVPDPVQLSADIQSARAAAQSAQTFGMIGIGVGVLGLLAALAVWLIRPRPRDSVSVSSARPAGERAS